MRARKLTVLQTLPALEAGGVERGALEVAGALARRGHRALVVSGGGALTAKLVDVGARHFTWPIGKKSPFTLLLARRLRRLLEAHQVDVLHARSRLPAWVAYLAWKGMPPCARPLFITTVHGCYSVNRYGEVMVRGQRVIAVSAFIRDYILSNYPRAEPDRISVIPRGVDPDVFRHGFTPPESWLRQWRQTHPQLQGKRLVTLPGRISRRKGHADFIRIIKALRLAGEPAHGLVVGAAHRAGLERELRRRVAACGLRDDVSFLGHRDDLREVLSVSAVTLSLSAQPEAFGRTALEALSLGRPVVAYSHGGVRETLARLQPAGLTPPGDHRAATEKIRQFLRAPPVIAPNRDFTLAQMLDKTLTLYEQAAATRPGVPEARAS